MPGKKKTTKVRPQAKFEDLVADAAINRVMPVLQQQLDPIYQQLQNIQQLTSEVAILASSFAVLQAALIDQKIVEAGDLRERNVVYEDLLHGFKKSEDDAVVTEGDIIRRSAAIVAEDGTASEARPVKFKVDLETELSKAILGLKTTDSKDVDLPIPDKDGETQKYKVTIDRISREILQPAPVAEVVNDQS